MFDRIQRDSWWADCLSGHGLAAGEQRQAAQPDAGHDGHAASDLREADRVSERHRARDGADQRLEVEERPGDLAVLAALLVRDGHTNIVCL